MRLERITAEQERKGNSATKMRLARITQGAGREGSTLGLQRSYRNSAGRLQAGKKHNWPAYREVS